MQGYVCIRPCIRQVQLCAADHETSSVTVFRDPRSGPLRLLRGQQATWRPRPKAISQPIRLTHQSLLPPCLSMAPSLSEQPAWENRTRRTPPAPAVRPGSTCRRYIQANFGIVKILSGYKGDNPFSCGSFRGTRLADQGTTGPRHIACHQCAGHAIRPSPSASTVRHDGPSHQALPTRPAAADERG